MSSKTIFLMGAPSGRLQWDEEHLLKKAVPPFADTSSSGTASQQPAESHTEYTSKWRVLRSDRTAQMRRRSKEMQQHHSALFLDTTSLTAKMPRLRDDDDDDNNNNNVLLSRFYEHSLSILNTSTSSCSSFPDSEDWVNEDDDEEEEEEEEKENSTVQRLDSERTASWGAIDQAVLFPQLRDLHNIKDIPSAAYLRSIIPQTLSVNLVVAVINVHPVKRVTARQTKQELEILELVVGDETRTGFGVTFWLPLPLSENNEGQTHHPFLPPPPPPPHHHHHRSRPSNENPNAEFRRKILDIRPRDILLMRNVGLSSFQDLVYGQSLRKGMTKVDLLYRPQFDSQAVQGVYSALAIDTATRDDRLLCKVRKVRDWLMNYLGIAAAPCGEHKNAHLLPPDTPDIEGH